MTRLPLILIFGLIGMKIFAQSTDATLLEKVMQIEKAVANNSTRLEFVLDAGVMLEEAQITENVNLIHRTRTALAAYQALVQKQRNLDNKNYIEQAWAREQKRQGYLAKNSFLNFISSVSLGVMGFGLVSFSASSVFGDTFYKDFLQAANGSPEQQQAYAKMVIADYVSLGSAFLALGGAAVFCVFQFLR